MVRVLLLSLLFCSSSVLAEQDPTAPLGWLVPKEQKAAPVKKASTRYRLPSLQSIVCKGESPCYAILNGQVVSQGEVIRGYKVKKIDSEYVTLQRSTQQWKLELFSLDIKKN